MDTKVEIDKSSVDEKVKRFKPKQLDPELEAAQMMEGVLANLIVLQTYFEANPSQIPPTITSIRDIAEQLRSARRSARRNTRAEVEYMHVDGPINELNHIAHGGADGGGGHHTTGYLEVMGNATVGESTYTTTANTGLAYTVADNTAERHMLRDVLRRPVEERVSLAERAASDHIARHRPERERNI